MKQKQNRHGAQGLAGRGPGVLQKNPVRPVNKNTEADVKDDQ